ncbi:hypothetical protein D3C71_1965290 [compost metagenome]
MINITVIRTNKPIVIIVEKRCARGPIVIPQLTKNDHKPLQKWNVADTIPTRYKINTTGFVAISCIVLPSASCATLPRAT